MSKNNQKPRKNREGTVYFLNYWRNKKERNHNVFKFELRIVRNVTESMFMLIRYSTPYIEMLCILFLSSWRTPAESYSFRILNYLNYS